MGLSNCFSEQLRKDGLLAAGLVVGPTVNQVMHPEWPLGVSELGPDWTETFEDRLLAFQIESAVVLGNGLEQSIPNRRERSFPTLTDEVGGGVRELVDLSFQQA